MNFIYKSNKKGSLLVFELIIFSYVVAWYCCTSVSKPKAYTEIGDSEVRICSSWE